jgi:hypothetical protein
MSLKDLAEIIDHLATAIGILLGGGWVFYQYVIRRSGETGLSIDIRSTVSARPDGRRLLFLDVTKNTAMRGRRSVATSDSLAEQFARRSATLVRIPQGRALTRKAPHVDWWQEPVWPALPEVNCHRIHRRAGARSSLWSPARVPPAPRSSTGAYLRKLCLTVKDKPSIERLHAVSRRHHHEGRTKPELRSRS